MTYSSHILSVEQMYEADRLTIEGGISGLELMENAGQGITAHIEKGWDKCSVLILCGPGNNGGDGYVVARALSEAGWPVRVCAYGDPAKLKGDALAMYKAFTGEVHDWSAVDLSEADLVVDALFGAGFRGQLPPDIVEVFAAVNVVKIPVVAVDVPSGVNGSSGEVSDGTPACNLTVSFFRCKIGHLLYPAKFYLGVLEIIDIGIPDNVLDKISCQSSENDPDTWRGRLQQLSPTGHKYDRGHGAVVGGGMSSTGAARIAAKAALRVGAGAVTVVTPPSALLPYSIALEAVMVTAINDADDFKDWLVTKRIGSVLIGPGGGVHERTRAFVLAALQTDGTVILDADALTVFKDNPAILFDQISRKTVGQVVLTPHEAEFKRLFNVDGSADQRCQQAADQSGAVVLLKGASTVIAEPKGRLVINTNAPPWLATAGSGDALAGIITGLTAATTDVYEAVCAAVWIHGEAANKFGPGLIAEDIEAEIPGVLSDLINR